MVDVAALCIGGPCAGRVQGVPAHRLGAGHVAVEVKQTAWGEASGPEVHYSYEEVTLLGRAFPILVADGLPVGDRERVVAEALLQAQALALWRAASPA